jgi:flagellar basal body-associated protein FliL
MSEEQENDGTWSGLKKTIIGTLATVVTAGGAWIGTTLFGGGDEGAATQQAAPAPVVVNVQQNQENTQQQKGGNTTVIKETIKEVPAQPAKEEKKSESEDAPW